jgi:hypothetical protein
MSALLDGLWKVQRQHVLQTVVKHPFFAVVQVVVCSAQRTCTLLLVVLREKVKRFRVDLVLENAVLAELVVATNDSDGLVQAVEADGAAIVFQAGIAVLQEGEQLSEVLVVEGEESVSLGVEALDDAV